MDTLHTVLRTISAETKSDKTHLDVFREFLAHLGKMQPAPAPKRQPAKASARRKPMRRVPG